MAWGDEERRQGLESLLEVYGPAVLHRLHEVLGDAEVAREAFVSVFLEACREGDRLCKPSEAKRRLYRVVERVCRDILRRRGLRGAALRDALSKVGTTVAPADLPPVPPALRTRVLHLLPAGLASVAAERQYRGPSWTFGGVLALLILSAGCLAYGLYQPAAHTSGSGSERASAPVANLPPPLQNLPVQTLAQFRLHDAASLPSLDHVAITSDALYTARLQYSGSGAASIEVQACPFSGNGGPLTWRHQVTIRLLPPVSAPGGRSLAVIGGDAWKVTAWRVDATGPWLVATVQWGRARARTAQHDRPITQLYAVYTPSGQYALAKSFEPRTGQGDSFTVAVGAGRVIVQSTFSGPGTQQPPVGLPIQVFDLEGTDPAHALHLVQTLPAPFGAMVAPTVTSQGIVFQGISGRSDPGDAVNATWYSVSWAGEVSELTGPPLDGRPHWVVDGQDGRAWWAETTPAADPKAGVQVLMAPLTAAGELATSPALTLSGAVTAFEAYGSFVLWVQGDSGTEQVVVSRVQGGSA